MRNRGHTGSRGGRGRLSLRREIGVYVVFGVLWASGATWLVARYFLRPAGELADVPGAGESWWIRLHALAGFLALWLLGLLWVVHVLPAWRSGRRRISGIILAALLIVLIGSAYLLYYVGDEDARAMISTVHWLLGLLFALPFLLHLLLRRQRRL